MTEEAKMKEAVVNPISVNEKRCKSCAKCVRECPAGVLSMRVCPESIYGIMISVDRPDLCTWCGKCENACPDIAIFVLERVKGVKYPKLSSEARERQEKILANDCRTITEVS